MKELVENFDLIAERKKVKEANTAIEKERNQEEVKKNKEDKEGGAGKRGGVKPEAEKQFKQPTGAHPEKISAEFTPLMAKQWAEDIRLYIRTCSNLEIEEKLVYTIFS